mgnify:CR=1 FL=1
MKHNNVKINKEKHEKFTTTTVVMLVVLILYTVSLFIPLLWASITAFKDYFDFRINVIGLPEKWVWNFGTVFNGFKIPIVSDDGGRSIGMMEMYLNSILYAVGCALCKTLTLCITAYCCARFPYKFSKVVHTVVIICMVLPIVGSLPSEISMAKALGLFDHVWGQWVMKCSFLGMYFLVFYSIFKAMPNGYTEAAKVDGAGNLRILLQIVMPLVRNTFFTVALIMFIDYWNDYQIPLVYMPTHPTVAYGLFYLANTDQAGGDLATVPMRMAGAIMMLIPTIILFLCFHKRLLGNLTMGGLKG